MKRRRFLRAREVARLLDLNTETIYRLARQGRLPSVRPTPWAVRFDPDELEAFLAARRHPGREGARR